MSESGLSINGPETLGRCLLLFLLAVGIASYGAVDYVQSTDAVRDAVETDATITDVDVRSESVGSGTSRSVEYQPTVSFTYTFDGRQYEGDDLFAGSVPPSYETERAARDVVSEYESGMTTTAYVDPDDPDTAFLKNRTSNQHFLLVGIGVVMALFGAFFVVKNYRERG
jgi:hypothetical protein